MAIDNSTNDFDNQRTETLDDQLIPTPGTTSDDSLVSGVEVAQASDLGDVAPVDAADSAAPATPASAFPEEIIPTADNEVRFPNGTSFDDVEIVGRDLVLKQADGSEIVIKNAAVNVPTFIVDGVVIPQEVLVAALDSSGIDIAAGPNGTLIAVSGDADSSGGNFFINPPGIGEADPILDLLPPTALQFPELEERELFPGLREPEEDEPLRIISIEPRDPFSVDPDSPTDIPDGGLPPGGSSVRDGFVEDPDLPNGTTPAEDGENDEFIVRIQAGSSPVTNVVFDPDNGLSGPISQISSNVLGASTTADFTYELSPDGQTLIVLADGVPIVQLVIDFTPGADNIAPETIGEISIDITLLEAFPHEDGVDGAAIIQGIPLLAEDDNGFNDVGTFSLGIVDDKPTLTVDVSEEGQFSKGLFLNVDETDDLPTETDDEIYDEIYDDSETLSDVADARLVGSGADRYADGEGSDDMNPDGNGEAPGLGTVQTSIPGAGGLLSLFTVDGAFGADGMGSDVGTLSFIFSSGGPLATNLSATNGGPISLVLEGGVIVGRDAAGLGDAVFTISIVEVPAASGNFQLELMQYEAIFHENTRYYDDTTLLNTAAATDEFRVYDEQELFDEVAELLLSGDEEVSLQYSVTRTDGDGDSVTDSAQIDLINGETSYFSFDDDGPTLTVTANVEIGSDVLSMELDETIGDDRANSTGEVADGNTDDDVELPVDEFLGRVNTDVSGGLTSLFTIGGDFGSDGMGSEVKTLSFVGVESGSPLATTLSSTEGGLISLTYVSDTQINGVDAANNIVFTIEIIESPTGSGEFQLQTTLLEAIDHGDDGNLYDANLPLLIGFGDDQGGGALQLQYSVTRTDGDNDSITVTDQIDLATVKSSFISFDDDGPLLGEVTAAGAGDLTLDESVAGDDRDGPGEAAANTTMAMVDYSGNFADVDYGSDGAGTTTYSFDATALTDGTDSGLFALNTTDGIFSEGDPILLYLSADGKTITGSTAASEAGILPANSYFTITVDGDGKVTFAQNQNIFHGNSDDSDDSESINLDAGTIVLQQTVTDKDGDAAIADLDLSGGIFAIEDDGPLAVADIDSVTEDGATVADGNVLTGGGGTDANGTDGVTDTQGADGATVTSVSFGATAGAIAGTTSGAYGDLVLNANGSYEYTLDNTNTTVQSLANGETLTEIFTYEITDGDGDVSETTLTITINGADDGVTITGLDGNAPEVIVDEDDLIDGSSPDNGALTKTGSFSFSAADGADEVTIGSTTIFTGGAFVGAPVTVTTAAYGTLTITGFTPDPASPPGTVIGGTFQYSYTLDDNTLTHPTANGENSITESLLVTVTDTDGDDDTANLDIQVIDDVPLAVADIDSVTEDGATVADGNVLTGGGGTDANGTDGVTDTQGADGATVTSVSFGATAGAIAGTTSGAYGDLVLNANGSYEYTLDNTNTTVQSLANGETLTEIFTYEITDGDGDVSETTLTITINGADDGVTITGLDGNAPEVIVDEDDLIDGSSPNDPALTKTGSFSFSAADGADVVTIGSTTIFTGGAFVGAPVTVTTAAYGTLTITGFTPDPASPPGTVIGGTFQYSYTLDDNTLTHPTANGENSITESLLVTVTDTDGDDDTANLDIQVIDDVPLAVADIDSVTEDGATVADGNVLTGGGGTDANGTDGVTDTQGADGATVTSVSFGATAGAIAGTTSGAYGDLVLNANGSYEYTLDNTNTTVQSLANGETLTEIFTYEITDGDGDVSETTLTITINGADDGVTITGLDGNAPEVIVDEDDLIDGSSPDNGALTKTGSFSFSAADGADVVTIGSTTIFTGGAFVGAPVTVTTAAYGTLTITGFTPDPASPPGTVIGGTFQYSYTLDDNTLTHPTANGENSITESLLVTVTDTDGDDDTANLDIQVIDDVPLAVADIDSVTEDGATVADGNVLTGGGGTDANGTDGVTDTQGADGATVTSVSFGATAGAIAGTTSGAYGDLVLNANGSYEYTLDNTNTTVQSLANGETLTEIFTYEITDGDGDVSETTLTITINGADDGVTITGLDGNAPEVIVDEDDLIDGSSPNDPALTKTGSFSFSAADGADEVTIGSTTIFTGGAFVGAPVTVTTAAYGTLTITGFTPDPASPPGTVIGGTFQYSYTLDDNTLTHPTANGENSITESLLVTVTDTDGDDDTANLDIQVIDDVPLAVADIDSVTEDGATVADGNVLTGGGGTDANGTDGVTDTQGADGATVTSVSFGATAGAIAGTTSGAYGDLVLNANGSYEYTLDNTNTTVQSLANGETLTEIFTYEITDGDGDVSETTLTITINGADDGVTITGLDGNAPEVIVDEDDLIDGSSPNDPALTKTGSFSFSAADGADEVTIGSTTIFTGGAFVGAPVTVTTAAYGTLTITGFTPDPASPPGTVIGGTFQYSYTLDDNTLTHPTANGENSITESLLVTVTDTDGDDDTANLDIQVIDDVPLAKADTDTVNLGTASVPVNAAFMLDFSGSVNDGEYEDLIAGVRAAGAQLFATSGGAGVTITLLAFSSSAATLGTFNNLADFNAYLDTIDDAGDRPFDGGTDFVDAINEIINNYTPLAGQDNQVFFLTDGNPSTGGTPSAAQLDDWEDFLQGTGTYAGQPAINFNGVGIGDGVTPSNIDALDLDGNAVNTVIVADFEALVDDLGGLIVTASPATGNVLTGTDGVGGDSNTEDGVADMSGADGWAPGGGVVGVAFGGTTGTVGNAIAGTYGSLVLNADGSYTYTPNSDLDITDPVSDEFTYTVEDGDGDQSTSTLTININPPLTAADDDALVNEDGLANGTDAASDSEVFSGNITPSGGVGPYTITLTDPADGMGDFGTLVLNSDGSYTYTLTAPFDTTPNADNGEQTELAKDSFSYTVEDANGNTFTGSIDVDIIDDVPTAAADVDSVNLGTASIPVNVAFMLDMSGSVNSSEYEDLIAGVRAAGAQLFTTSGSAGVTITLLAFSGSSDDLGTFNNLADFNAYLDTIDQASERPFNGQTNFEAALDEIMASFTPIAGQDNQVFFLTDGDPNTGGGTGNLPTTTQLDIWQDYLLGTGTPATPPVNFTGVGITSAVTPANIDALDLDGDVNTVIVTDFAALVDGLGGLITTGGIATGNVITGTDGVGGDSNSTDGVADTSGADGWAPGGGVVGVAFGGTVGTVGVALAGTYGSLVLNADGTYTYETNDGLTLTSSVSDVFTYTIEDGDGDQSTTTLTINIAPPPDAVNDIVLTNIVDLSPIDIDNEALLYNDIEVNAPLSVDSVDNPSGGTVSQPSDVEFDPVASAGGTRTYDFASVTVNNLNRAYEYEVDPSGTNPNNIGILDFNTFGFGIGGPGSSSDNEATSGQYDSISSTANQSWVINDPGNNDFAVFWSQFQIEEVPSLITEISVTVVVNSADNNSDLGIWNYNTSQWELLDGFTPTGGGNETWTGSVNSTSDTISDYLNGDGQVTIAFVNADESDSFTVDYVSVEVTTSPATSFTSGSFEYTVDDGGSFNDTANVAITGIDSATVTGTADDEILVGNDSGSTLDGAGGNDYIIGGAVGDTLIGGDGEDILAGGLGVDTLWGGDQGGTGDGDKDTFVIDDTTAVDIIGDFEAGVDQIDLTGLLDGISATDLETGGYVNKVEAGGNTTIQVDVDGGGDNYVDAVELNGTFTDETITILFGDDSGGTGSDGV